MTDRHNSHTPSSASAQATLRRNMAVAAACGACVALMVGAAYAAVPLYNWFCRTTGFGGTPVVASTSPTETLGRKVTIRFDSNVAPGLPWKFEPERNAVDVRIGEVVTVFYKVTNLAARETAAQATYNVTPLSIGGYFQKINCFCFNEQTLKPGETREMPVVFYVDPALAGDPEQNQLNTITLSYTFHPLRAPAPPAGAAEAAASSRS